MIFLRKILMFFLLFSLIIFCLAKENEPKPKSLVLTQARLIDGTGSPPQENMVIVIRDDKFFAIGPKDVVTIPKESEVIDVKGKTVIPGLIDTHVHFTYPPKEEDFFLINDSISSFRAVHFLHRYLMVGVTTVRDVASYQNVGVVTKKAFKEGLFIGSRPIVVRQGVTCTGGHATEKERIGIAVEVDGPAGFRRAVREQLKAGADLIKVLPPYSEEEIKAAIEETHFSGRIVTVHAGRGGSMLGEYYDFIRWAIEYGADCVEHAFAIPDEVIQMMAKKEVYCVPTVSILLRIANKFLQKNPGQEHRMKEFLGSVEIFRKMKKAGVKMGVGTDAVGENMVAYPLFYFEEIERFVELGYTPMEAIIAATKINAEICGASDRLGTIEKGKLADLLVIEEDPLSNIKNLRNVKIIIQGGKVIKR